jgi:hypothetical protein
LYLFFQGVLCNWGCTQMQISMKSPPFSQKKGCEGVYARPGSLYLTCLLKFL